MLTGRSDELVAQATGLVDALTTLDEIDQVTVSDVVAQSEDWPQQRPIETVTSRLRVAGAHHLELPILLEQTDFGQPVTSYRIRLGGVASPTRSADATGTQLGLWVGDEILEVLELDENGRFDLETTIAGDRVDRAIVMKLVLDLQIEGCPAGDSLGIQLDRGSWIEADFGQGVEPGFGRIPQAFGQGMAVDPGSTVSHLSTAADAVGLLQDTTNWSLNPVVTDRSQIAAAGPAVVVGADIELLDLLGAPVNGPSGRIDTGQATIAATSDVDSGTPVMQAFVSLDGSDILSIDAVAENAGFGLPDALSVHRFRQIRGTVVQLNESGLIEVAGITLERSANHDEVALAPLASGTGGGHLNSSANGMARRELFALGLAATMLVAGVVMFGRRSVRAAARANTISR